VHVTPDHLGGKPWTSQRHASKFTRFPRALRRRIGCARGRVKRRAVIAPACFGEKSFHCSVVLRPRKFLIFCAKAIASNFSLKIFAFLQRSRLTIARS
jgi:hypothetical protein